MDPISEFENFKRRVVTIASRIDRNWYLRDYKFAGPESYIRISKYQAHTFRVRDKQFRENW